MEKPEKNTFEKNRPEPGETGFDKVINTSVKVLFFAACIVVIILYAYYAENDKTGRPLNDERIYIEKWNITDSEGNVIRAGRKYSNDRAFEEDFIISTTIPEGVCDDDYLCFTTRSNTKVYIDGELRKSYDRIEDVALPHGAVKSFYMVVPLKAADVGRELEILRTKTDRRPEIVPETFISGMGGIYNFLFEYYGITFELALVLMAMSLVVMIAGISMRIWYKQSINMFYAAFGILITATWTICNSYMFPFVFGHYHIDGILSYFFCLMMPFGYLIYIDSIQKGKHRKLITVLLVISSVNLIVWPILHFTGIFLFSQALDIMDGVLAGIIVALFVVLVRDLKRGDVAGYKYTAIGFAGFLLLCFFETFTIIYIRPRNDGVLMVIGLLLLLGFVVLQQVDDLREISMEKQKAIELSDAKTAFLASMSHEIRTPINSILGMNEMILQDNKDPAIEKYALTVERSGKMLLSLVNDVLDFSKIEAGKLEIVENECLMSVLLSDVAAMAGERAGVKSIGFEVMITGDVPSVIYADEFRIKQVLINLINNGIKYTDEGKVTLEVSGSFVGDKKFDLCFNVNDTGRGIRKEELDSLFDAFSRADMQKNKNIEGTGLGLAIVKSIIDSMGGAISVESEYGLGSKFSIVVPVEVIDRTPIPQDFESFDEGRNVEKYTCDFRAGEANVLAVDDNRSNLNIVKLFLGRAGIEPDLCLSGMAAVNKCRTKKYDLILLDHMMPELDGIETLEIIRKEDASLNKDTPAIVLTANALSGSRRIYLDAGFDDYLAKPIDSARLIETVKGFIPPEKVIPITDDEERTEDTDIMDDSLKSRILGIEGMDYDTALENSGGDEEIMKVILSDVTDEQPERDRKMRELIRDGNYKDYRIEAHAMKGLMATIGHEGLSERAKKHEYAARDDDREFILGDFEGLLDEYRDICTKIKEVL